uniref:RAD9 checkpoint clamp component A n=1 Tax=Sus scrofa TaxID=9823 RepID=A0A8D1TRN8_PIG
MSSCFFFFNFKFMQIPGVISPVNGYQWASLLDKLLLGSQGQGGQMLPARFGSLPTARPSCCLLWALLLSAPALLASRLLSHSRLGAFDRAGSLSRSSCPSWGTLGLAWFSLDVGVCHCPAPGPLRAAGWGRALGVTLCAPSRVLGEAVLPFPPALAEVTLGIGRGRRVILRSYQEEEADSTAKAMVTEMSIGEEDFQQLQAQEGVAITFCLKEFRVRLRPLRSPPRPPSALAPPSPSLLPPHLTALPLPSQGLLSFAESANLSLSVYFDAPGRPAIFAIEDTLLDGHFVLATLSEPDPHSQDLRSSELQRPAPQLQAHSTPHLDDFAADDIDSYMIAMETTVGSEASRALPSDSLSPGLQALCSPGPDSEEEEDDTEPSTVPGTPPPKKFRSLFFGSILAPTHSPQGPSPVLAEDSEGEG